ncbi:hypothetical protein BDV59DRAFT_189969 [Aspergillus ambiguus]|uniref:uncharacterized protein n=1 Tax=Aspergillus ambiguus TaxID=176160 RepID=UPI003CCC965F
MTVRARVKRGNDGHAYGIRESKNGEGRTRELRSEEETKAEVDRSGGRMFQEKTKRGEG